MRTVIREGIRDGVAVRRLDAIGVFAVYVEDRASQTFKVVDKYRGLPISTLSRAKAVALLEELAILRQDGRAASVKVAAYDMESNELVWSDEASPSDFDADEPTEPQPWCHQCGKPSGGYYFCAACGRGEFGGFQ